MANTILTPTAVTREALRILHQKANFLGTINRQYDDSFAKTGAKIGSSLKIRKPNQYTVTTGSTLVTQDTAEASVTLTVATQKHVGLNFTSQDLTLSLQDFSERILQPAMAVLVANVESDAMSMFNDVYQIWDNDGVAFALKDVLRGKKFLSDSLTPPDRRVAMLSTLHTVNFIDSTKALFQDSKQIASQFREGKLGTIAGFDFYENTNVVDHTTGTAAKTTGYTVNGASQTGASVTVQTGTTTFLVGDRVTFAGCNRVHPETKANTGQLQQFVITANSGANATSLSISPSIVTTGATQNVSASPTNGGAVVKLAAGASETTNNTCVYHPDAFTFATADLEMPGPSKFAAREVMDGISLRIWQDSDIINDKFPCRIDILYGYKTIRPEMAAILHADG